MLIAGAAIVFGIGAVQWLAKPDMTTPAPPAASTPTSRPALTVEAIRPRSTELPVQVSANGDIAIWQEASIGAEADGWRIESVRVDVGDSVRQGEVLATFTSEMIAANLAQAHAAVAEAQAEAQKAKANADRARNLQGGNSLTAQQINDYLTAELSALARLEAARAAEDVQRLRLKRTQVIAPDSGIITARTVSVGAVIGSGTELFRLMRQGRLEWRAEVLATELGRIKPGDTATLDAPNGARITGKVRRIAPTVDPKRRSALVYVDLPASAPVKAGMFASGRFALGASKALTVPQQALVVRDGFNYVFRLNADGHVSQLRVDTGRRLGEEVEIVRGIGPDTVLVSRGAGFLNDGDLVKDVTASATGK